MSLRRRHITLIFISLMRDAAELRRRYAAGFATLRHYAMPAAIDLLR